MIPSKNIKGLGLLSVIPVNSVHARKLGSFEARITRNYQDIGVGWGGTPEEAVSAATNDARRTNELEKVAAEFLERLDEIL